ncbi:hypothetical protein HF992_09595 [Streptococcus ovuberis]|uniref:Uncharacterized protein n=1 Tax=Streptococcus ovuberis TaxID=1936207 RepID=A0A7X6S1E4_9STRE|nr:hypothetical protein [Streptococcus ovuberis]
MIYDNFGGGHNFLVDSSGVWIDGLLIIERISVTSNEEEVHSVEYAMPFAERWTKFNVFRTRQSYYDAIAGIGLSAILALIPGWQGAPIGFVAGAAHTLYTTFGKTELYLEIVQYHNSNYTLIKEVINAYHNSDYTGLVSTTSHTFRPFS